VCTYVCMYIEEGNSKLPNFLCFVFSSFLSFIAEMDSRETMLVMPRLTGITGDISMIVAK
jgi:hypothetical protein